MKKSKLLLILLGAWCGLSACESPAVSTPPAPRVEEVIQGPPPVYQYPFRTPSQLEEVIEWGRLPEGPLREKARQESNRIFKEGALLGTKLSKTLIEQVKTRPVDEAIAEIRAQLTAEQGTEHHAFTAQVLAMSLLNHFLAEGQLHHTAPAMLSKKLLAPEAQSVIAFATETLIAQGNPNADLLAASLYTLRGYWTEAQLQAQASLAMREATVWLDRKAACTTCSAKNPSSDVRQQQIRAGLADLQRLIDG
jgi:hypothetical protein